DGVYKAESFMDDDGVRLGERVPIRVRVEIAGERMKVDLTDVAKQVAGFYSAGEPAGRASCQVAFKCLTSPLDLPINDGQFRALEIVLPPGRVVSALKPAAMRMWMTYPMTIIDTIFKALAPTPGRPPYGDALSDDNHRHHLQGARARHSRAHHRRPPRRSRGRPRQ